MSAFNEVLHPRGQAANAGQFRDKTNSDPVGSLLTAESTCSSCSAPITNGGVAGKCDNCASEWGCQRCGDVKDSEDMLLCVSCRMDPSIADQLDPEQLLEQKAAIRRQEELRWGSTTVREGSRTPWGAAQTVEHVAPGITAVGTAGHGGVKLSTERNAAVPTALRNSSGWYEEDVEIEKVVAIFPEAFTRSRTVAEMRDSAESSIRNWMPEEYEKWKGVTLEPGQSRERDRREWAKAHADEFVSNGASTSLAFPDHVVVTGRKADGTSAEFLIPKAEYDTRLDDNGDFGRDNRLVLDPTRHKVLPPKVAVKQEKKVNRRHREVADTHDIARDPKLTQAAANRILGDMHKRWDLDGKVMTFHEIIQEEGVTSRTAHVENGKRRYTVIQQEAEGSPRYSFPVSKATFDYLSNVPDERSAAQVASQDADVYRATVESKWDWTHADKAKLARLEARADELRAAELAELEARGESHQQKHEAYVASQAERERAAAVMV